MELGKGVSPFDPATIVATVLLLTVVALMACGVPVRRAIHVQPGLALRQEKTSSVHAGAAVRRAILVTFMLYK
jgi:hypothetical protein